jgi:hypothetical protein
MQCLWKLCAMWIDVEKNNRSQAILFAAADSIVDLFTCPNDDSTKPVNVKLVPTMLDASHRTTTRVDKEKRVGTRWRRHRRRPIESQFHSCAAALLVCAFRSWLADTCCVLLVGERDRVCAGGRLHLVCVSDVSAEYVCVSSFPAHTTTHTARPP